MCPPRMARISFPLWANACKTGWFGFGPRHSAPVDQKERALWPQDQSQHPGCTPLGYIAWSRQRTTQPRKAQKLPLAVASVRQGVWWLFMLSHPEQEPEATQLQKPHVQAYIHWPTQGSQWHSTALGRKHHWTLAWSIWLCCVWNCGLFLGAKAWGDSQGSDLRTMQIAPTKPVGAIPKIGYWTRSRPLYP